MMTTLISNPPRADAPRGAPGAPVMDAARVDALLAQFGLTGGRFS